MPVQALSADTRSLDEIYEAAQKESGPLFVAAGGDAQAQWDAVRAAWAQRFPKIKLDLVVDFSKYHDSKLDRCLAEDEHWCDILFLQDLHVYPRYKQQNDLLPYKPPTFDDMYTSHQDPDGAYLGIAIWKFGIFLYDKSKVSEKDLPKNYLDLLKPEWKGKIIATIPNDDDAIGYLFSLIVGKYGWEWLEQFNKQNVQWVRGTATPAYMLAEGADPKKAGSKRPKEYVSDNQERCITFTTAGYPLESDVLAWKAPDAPERYMSWSQTAAILKSTPRPETAKLFIAFVTSKEFQEMLSAGGTAPVMLRSLDKKNGTGNYDDSAQTNMNGFRVYDLDRRMADWWRMQYESILGTAQGVSPMEVYDFDDARAFGQSGR